MTRSQYDRHRKLVEETEDKLSAAQKKVGEAASHGDLSENAEYDAAVEECAFYSGRLEELHVQMIGVDIVDPRNTIEGMVTIGKTVEIEDLETEERRVHHIVGNGTLDSGRGEVSYAAPFGAALIGHSAGEEVTIALPAGQQRVRILSIAVTE